MKRVTPDDLPPARGESDEALRRVCEEAVRNGYLRRTARNEYKLTAEGLRFLEQLPPRPADLPIDVPVLDDPDDAPIPVDLPAGGVLPRRPAPGSAPSADRRAEGGR